MDLVGTQATDGHWHVVREMGHSMIRVRKTALALMALAIVVAGILGTAGTALAASTVPVHRLYNRWSREHLFTTSTAEVTANVKSGWNYEGVAWEAPQASGSEVRRLYNRWTNEHFYTRDANELRQLKAAGWTDEGRAWYSDDAQSIPVYRLFNRWEGDGIASHHYTIAAGEYNGLGSQGWNREGAKWYASGDGSSYNRYAMKDVEGWWSGGGTSSHTDYSKGTIDHYTMVHRIAGDTCYSYEQSYVTDLNGNVVSGTRLDYQGSSPATVMPIDTRAGTGLRVFTNLGRGEYDGYWWYPSRDRDRLYISETPNDDVMGVLHRSASAPAGWRG